MKTLRITRKTRSLGWDYSTSWNGNGIIPPTKPYHSGTLNQVLTAVGCDADFQLTMRGGTYYAVQWFYKGKPIYSKERSVTLSMQLAYLDTKVIDYVDAVFSLDDQVSYGVSSEALEDGV